MLKKLIDKLAISQVEFSRRTGVPPSAISMHLNWEKGLGGRRLGAALSAKIARAFPDDISLVDLRPELDTNSDATSGPSAENQAS